jgi:hypothetical protein
MADNFFAQFDEPNASDQGASEGDVVDNSPKVSPEQMTPRLKAAQEAVWRNAHQLQVLPFNSPEYQAALTQGSQLTAEYQKHLLGLPHRGNPPPANLMPTSQRLQPIRLLLSTTPTCQRTTGRTNSVLVGATSLKASAGCLTFLQGH